MAKIRWDGDAASAVRATEAITAAVKKLGEETQEASTSAKILDSRARAIAEAASPQEKYNRKMRELAELLAKNKITMDQAHASAMRYGRELDRAGESGRKAFDSSMLLQFTGGLTSVSGVVALITKAFQGAEEAAQKAADQMLESLGAAGEMAQLGTEGLARGMEIANALIAGGTTKSKTEALTIATNMINAGLNEDQTSLITRDLGGAGGLVSAANMNQVGGDLKKLMTQFGETDMRSLSTGVLVAANKTQADLAVTANNMLKFGLGAKLGGFDLNEASAAYVAAETQAATPETAAEYLKSFFSATTAQRLNVDGDLEKTLDSIAAKIPQGGTAKDVLKDQNAVYGYEALQKDRGLLRANLAEISARPTDLIPNARAELAKQSPGYAAAAAQKIEEGRLQVALEETATPELLFEAAMSARTRRRKERGQGGVRRWLNEYTERIDDMLGAEYFLISQEYERARRGEPGAVSPETMEAMGAWLGRQTEIMEEDQSRSRRNQAVRRE